MSPLDKSDRVLMEMEVMGIVDGDLREKLRENRRNYGMASFVELIFFLTK